MKLRFIALKLLKFFLLDIKLVIVKNILEGLII